MEARETMAIGLDEGEVLQVVCVLEGRILYSVNEE